MGEKWYATQPEWCNGWWIVSTDKLGYENIDESGDGGFSEDTAHRIASLPELEANYKEAVELLNDTESLIMDDILGLDDFSECDPVLFKETVKHMLSKHIEKILVALAKAEGK